MEIRAFDNDITIMYIQAATFPEGLPAAYEKLHSLLPFGPERKFLSVSRMEAGGGISYKAGAEVVDDTEPQQLGLPMLTLKKGRYASITITNFMEDTSALGRAFSQLMQHPGIDPEGYCVEWYFNDPDVHCMIRLED